MLLQIFNAGSWYKKLVIIVKTLSLVNNIIWILNFNFVYEKQINNTLPFQFFKSLFINLQRLLFYIKWDFTFSLRHLISQSSSTPYHELLQGFISQLKMHL